MKKVNVMAIINHLDLGGAETYLVGLLQNIDRANFPPFVCCLYHKGELAPELEKIDIPVIELNLPGGKANFFYGIPRLVKLIKKYKIDLVSTHLIDPGRIGPIAAKISRIPCISRVEGTYTYRTRKERTIDRLCLSFSSRVIACSRRVEKYCLNNLNIKTQKLNFIPNRVDIERFKKNNQDKTEFLQNQLGINENFLVVGTVGRLVIEKGYEYLIKAIPITLQKFPSAHFLFVGDGPLRQKLKRLVDALHISRNVIFAGAQKDVKDFLDIMDIFILPSKTEGFSLAIIEAMAKAKPVIATAVGGNPEIVEEGVTGILVPPMNVVRLSEATLDLLNHKEKRVTFGLQGYQRVKESYDIKMSVREYEDIFETVIK